MYDQKIVDVIKDNFKEEKAMEMLDESKYDIVTEKEFLNYYFGGFENRNNMDWYGLLNTLDVKQLQSFKDNNNFQMLFNDFLEIDQGIYYDREESETLFTKNENYYIFKLKKQQF